MPLIRVSLPSALAVLLACFGTLTSNAETGQPPDEVTMIARIERRIDERIDRLEDRVWLILGGGGLAGISLGGVLSLRRGKGYG